MIKRLLYIMLLLFFIESVAELNPKQEDVFERKAVYTVINNTQDPMDVTWQSGGGSSYDVLNGKEGSLYLSPVTSPSNRGNIVTPGDCLDFITVKSKSSGATGKVESICKENVFFEYEAEDSKNQKLVFKIS